MTTKTTNLHITPKDLIKVKIAKLIAKAESTTHIEEADAFMAKALEMLEANGIKLQEVGTINIDDPVTNIENAAYAFRAEYALTNVAHALARYYGCRSLYHREGRNKIVIEVVGRQSACITFQLMFPYVKKQVHRLAARSVHPNLYATKSKALTSIANGLTERLDRLYWENRDMNLKSEPKGENALVPVDAIDQFVMMLHPDLQKSRKSSWAGSDATGRTLAANVKIDRQVNHERRQITNY